MLVIVVNQCYIKRIMIIDIIFLKVSTSYSLMKIIYSDNSFILINNDIII